MLDPFLPEKPEDVERLKAIQREIHESFIALVKARRGAKLDSRETALFSGEYWTGQRGRELGLVDAHRRSAHDLARALRRQGANAADRRARLCLFGRRVPGVSHGARALWSGPSLADDMVSTLEARALWSRYGL